MHISILLQKNQCTDYFRKQQPIPLDENFEISSETESFETSFVVNQALNLLSEDLQEIILLKFSNELRIGEIATFLGISRFAVYRKLNMALKNLKCTLREEDFYE